MFFLKYIYGLFLISQLLPYGRDFSFFVYNGHPLRLLQWVKSARLAASSIKYNQLLNNNARCICIVRPFSAERQELYSIWALYFCFRMLLLYSVANNWTLAICTILLCRVPLCDIWHKTTFFSFLCIFLRAKMHRIMRRQPVFAQKMFISYCEPTERNVSKSSLLDV